MQFRPRAIGSRSPKSLFSIPGTVNRSEVGGARDRRKSESNIEEMGFTCRSRRSPIALTSLTDLLKRVLICEGLHVVLMLSVGDCLEI